MLESIASLFILIAVAMAAYMLPSFVAFARGHHQRLAITTLNIFFGWSLLGWVAALVWAFTAVQSATNQS